MNTAFGLYHEYIRKQMVLQKQKEGQNKAEYLQQSKASMQILQKK